MEIINLLIVVIEMYEIGVFVFLFLIVILLFMERMKLEIENFSRVFKILVLDNKF